MSTGRQGIPLERDISSRLLPWLLAIMVYLVALALYSALAMHKIAGQWDVTHSAHLTVQLAPPILALSDEATDETEFSAEQEENLEQILSLLRDKPEVATATRLEREELEALLEPWLGDDGDAGDLPLPQLIAITLKEGATPDVKALEEEVREISSDALVTDHKSGLEGLVDLALWVRFVAAGVIALVAMAAILMAILITKMGLAAHAHIIELLHLMGAEDRYVALQFQRHALSGGLIGGLIGLAVALATFAVIDQLTRGVDHHLVPNISLSAPQWAAFLLLPLACALVTTVTVRVTVLRSLSRMP